MIELQSVWNEIEDELSELDQDMDDFPDIRTSSSSQTLDVIEEFTTLTSTTTTTTISTSTVLPTTDHLLAQFFGDYAYEFDRFQTEEDSDSDTGSVASPLEGSPSILEELIIVQPRIVAEAVPVPTFDYITKEEKPQTPEAELAIALASPLASTNSSNSEDEDYPSIRFSKRRLLSDDEDYSPKKRQQISPSAVHSSPQVISTPPPAIVPVTPSPRTYLLHLISNVLPPEKLAGVVEIVNTTSLVSTAESEEEIELEFDINALDEVTLKRLERYVESCLEFTKPKKRSTKTKRKGGKRGSKKKELRLSLAAMGEVLTMKHDILTDDESEVIDIMD